MNHCVARLALALCVVASPLACPGEARAQTAGVTAPPAEQYTVSPGGVDMRTGRYTYRQTDLSLGQPDGAGISLDRLETAGLPGHISPFANFASNWDITLTERRRNLISGALVTAGDSDFQVYVNEGGRLDTFSAVNLTAPFTQLSRSPSSKISHTGTRAAGGEVYTYTASDGTIIVFRSLGLLGASDCSETVRCAYASQLIRPDGEKFTFEYDIRSTGTRARLSAVVSNRGYLLLLEHGAADWNLVSKACVLNLAVMQRPSSNTCPSGGKSASYNYTSFGGAYRLASVSDALGKSWGFTYATAPASPSGYYKMGFLRPDDTTPWLVNLYGPQQNHFMISEDIVFRQDYADGQSWTYSYDYTPTEFNIPLGQPTHQVAGGEYSDASGNVTKVKFSFPEVPYSLKDHRPGQSVGQIMYYLGDLAAPKPLVYQDQNGDYVVDTSANALAGYQNLLMTLEVQSLIQCVECGGSSSYEFTVSFQVTPGPTQVTDALGRTTSFDYCDKTVIYLQYEPYSCSVIGLLQSNTDPEGNKTTYKYSSGRPVEARKIAKPGSALPDLVTTATYSNSCANWFVCNKPLTVTNPNGGTTSFVYDPVHGGVISEISPADQNGVRPVKRYQYTLRKAWLSNGGFYSQSGDGIYLLSGERMCLTSATSEPVSYASSCAAGAGDEVTTTYDYGPDNGSAGNNLLLRGKSVTSNGTTLRTCYGYDRDGNKISETSPRAGLAACN